MTVEEEIKKIEQEINWINKTVESLSKRKKNKLDKLMQLKIKELKNLTKKENEI